MNDNAKAILVLLMLTLWIVVFTVGPFFTVWSLNMLFRLEIPYSFTSWCAAFWLMLLISGSSISKRSRSN